MTISAQIIEVLDDLCRKFGLAIDWSQENIVPYLQELAGKYISWEIAMSWAWLVAGVVILIAGIVMIVIERKIDLASFGYFFGFITICAFIAITMTQVGDILTCKFFPEKQILEYVKHLMQTAN